MRAPVAFILFNRPSVTARVFERIRAARPRTLLLIADGPRDENEARSCAAARAVVEQIDWPCDVRRNYSEQNLGCRRRVSSGIDWVFEQVEEAIILEDDCLPNESFFQFCDTLLEKYRDDERVMQIGGTSMQFGRRPTSESYYFSAINLIWGWATWRRAWEKHYDVTMSRWPAVRETGFVADLVGDEPGRRMAAGFDSIFAGKTDSWDNQWTLSIWLAGGLTALPAVDLISNIGFGPGATHTRKADSIVANLPTEALEFPLRHPPAVVRNRQADDQTFANLIAGRAM